MLKDFIKSPLAILELKFYVRRENVDQMETKVLLAHLDPLDQMVLLVRSDTRVNKESKVL